MPMPRHYGVKLYKIDGCSSVQFIAAVADLHGGSYGLVIAVVADLQCCSYGLVIAEVSDLTLLRFLISHCCGC